VKLALRASLGLLAVGLFVAAAYEGLWRLENTPLASTTSPDDRLVAESHLLGEGAGRVYGQDGAPYATGVILRSRWLPLKSAGSKVVFAAYCRGETRLAWRGAKMLDIECATEGDPFVLIRMHRGVEIRWLPQEPVRGAHRHQGGWNHG
jgi:hypothetical protein